MTTYVLDASAVLRFIDNEAGSDRVAEIMSGENLLLISSIQWGEIAGVTYKLYGRSAMEETLRLLLRRGIKVVPATDQRAVRSALIKANRSIPFADAFCVELAGDSSRYILLTADFDMGLAKDDVTIEFLPVKPKPS